MSFSPPEPKIIGSTDETGTVWPTEMLQAPSWQIGLNCATANARDGSAKSA
jgi:hypothetical protein